MARVAIMSSRVEQATATAAKSQKANKTKTPAGSSRQSIPALVWRLSICCVNAKITKVATVTITTRAKTASLTKVRRKKKLLKPARA